MADLEPERGACVNNFGASLNPVVGNPIALRSGAKLLSAVDFESDDGRFRIGRNYRSTPVGRSSSFKQLPVGLAGGWQFDFEMELQLGTFSGSPASPNANVTLIAPDGSGYDFVLQSSGDWIPRTATGLVSTEYKLEFVGTLPSNLADVKTSSSEWRVTDANDRTWTLETFTPLNWTDYSFGRPTEIEERDGYTWTLDYASDGALETITDTFGRTANFTWSYFYITALIGVSNATPYPEAVGEIEFPDGTKARYSYDPPPALAAPSASQIERLVGVARLDASDNVVDETTYHYEDSRFVFALTGVTDFRNERIATYAYDDRGRAISTEGADGSDEYTVEYDEVSGDVTRRVVNPLGKPAVYHFTRFGSSPPDIRLVEIEGEVSTNCPASAREYTYDTDKFVETETDEEGRVTTYTRDSLGRPTVIVQADGTADEREIEITWHGTLNVPAEIAVPGLTTAMTYTSGLLTEIEQADTTTHAVPYSTNGQTRSWTLTYTTGGLVETIDGPMAGTGDTVEYTYDANGYLETFTDELGHVTEILSVNGRGQPTSVEDPNGLVTDLTYDDLGRLTSTIADPSSVAAETLINYDEAGNVIKIIQPDGAFLEFDYDGASRITTVTDNLDQTVTYTYDDMGNLTERQTKNATANLIFDAQQEFDELGRLLHVIRIGNNIWTLGYDKVDNLVSVENPATHERTYAYDSLNRMVEFVDEELAETDYARDDSDEIATVTDPNNFVTSYVRNGWGEAIQESSPDIGTIVYERDARGLVTERTDGRSVVTDYDYDDGGRMTETTYPASTGENVVYSYDSTAGGNPGIGRLTGITDAAGTVTYTYDLLGRIASETRVISGESYVVSYTWDDAGRMASITYPSGRIVTFDRDANGNVGAITTKETSSDPSVDIASSVAHAPFGPISDITHGNGLEEWRTFNTDAQVNAQGLLDGSTSLLHRSLSYLDGVGNLNQIEDLDNSANDEEYEYNFSYRLQEAFGPWGALVFDTDGVGNLTSRILDDGSTTVEQALGYASTSNQLEDVTTDSVLTREFASDGAGNVIEDTDVLGTTTTHYGYNEAGQLESVVLGSTPKGDYIYDYRSLMVSRTVQNTTPSGTYHLIHDLDGNVIAEADDNGDTQREYIWLEGRPVAVVADVSGTPTILHVHTDHIDRPIMMTDASKAVVWRATYLPYGEVYAITGTASLDYRFPGQWFQLESGLSYNWHRHYDPMVGRYLQPDPLGLDAGINRWAYAANSPLMKVDPDGQQTTPYPGIVGPPLILPPIAIPGTPENKRWTNWASSRVDGMLQRLFRRNETGAGQCEPKDDCDKEWEEAEALCADWLSGPNPPRGPTGGYTSISDCARGLVSERCGGNPYERE